MLSVTLMSFLPPNFLMSHFQKTLSIFKIQFISWLTSASTIRTILKNSISVFRITSAVHSCMCFHSHENQLFNPIQIQQSKEQILLLMVSCLVLLCYSDLQSSIMLSLVVVQMFSLSVSFCNKVDLNFLNHGFLKISHVNTTRGSIGFCQLEF